MWTGKWCLCPILKEGCVGRCLGHLVRTLPSADSLPEKVRGGNARDRCCVWGVSVDESKDKQKWLDFIKTEGLKGVQLLAGGWSKITKDYKITGIPRFMVFDKKGNIVSVDAPRPSSPELKKMLENEESRLKQIT